MFAGTLRNLLCLLIFPGIFNQQNQKYAEKSQETFSQYLAKSVVSLVDRWLLTAIEQIGEKVETR